MIIKRKKEIIISELRGCVKVEVVVLGSTSTFNLVVSVDVKQHLKKYIFLTWKFRTLLDCRRMHLTLSCIGLLSLSDSVSLCLSLSLDPQLTILNLRTQKRASRNLSMHCPNHLIYVDVPVRIF